MAPERFGAEAQGEVWAHPVWAEELRDAPIGTEHREAVSGGATETAVEGFRGLCR